MKPYACIAPGQNAQYVGMGSDLYNSSDSFIQKLARDRFEGASDIVGYDLAELCFKGPMEKLSQTLYTQPALLTHFTICFDVFRALHQKEFDEDFDFAVSAGASLGEYFALMVAGVMNFENTLKLVKQRAETMDSVIKDPNYDAGQQVCLNIDARSIDELCAQSGVQQSNCNYGEQTIVGGSKEAIDELRMILAKRMPNESLRKLRVIDMTTEAAFHTSLMTPARKTFAPIVSNYSFSPPQKHVVSNYTGNFYAEDGSDIKINLIYQIDNPVRWLYGMRTIIKELQETAQGKRMALFEFGGGKPPKKEEPPTPPEKQKSSFGGITRKNLKEMGIDPKRIFLCECISERTILEIIKSLKENGSSSNQ